MGSFAPDYEFDRADEVDIEDLLREVNNKFDIE